MVSGITNEKFFSVWDAGGIKNLGFQQQWRLIVWWGKSPWGSSAVRTAPEVLSGRCPTPRFQTPRWTPTHLCSAPSPAKQQATRNNPPTRRAGQPAPWRRRTQKGRSWRRTSWVKTSLWWTSWTRAAERPPWTWWRGFFHRRRRSWREPSRGGEHLRDPDSPHLPPGARTGGNTWTPVHSFSGCYGWTYVFIMAASKVLWFVQV